MIIYGGEWDLLCAHLRQHARHVDRFVLVEADCTHSGEARETTLERRRDELPVGDAELRIITLRQLDGADVARPMARGGRQRNAGYMGVADLPADTIVLVADVDELLAPATFDRLRDELESPVRLRLDVRYQFLDRRAPGWPCCEQHVPVELRRAPPATTDFAQPALLAARLGDLRPMGPQSPDGLRRRPKRRSDWTAGWHLTGIDPSVRQGRKEVIGAHAMTGRIVDPEHMARCARAGVHHRGWWYVVPAELPPELQRIADAIPGSCAPAPLPDARRRRALRARAEARQWERLPDRLVACIDRRFDDPGVVTTATAALADRWMVGRARRRDERETSRVPTTTTERITNDADLHDH
jgi:hypothetical protein